MPPSDMPTITRGAKFSVSINADVGSVCLDAIIRFVRPFGIAVAALVERDTAVVLRKLVADDVPGATGLTAAVQQQHRAVGVIAPFDVMEAHAAQKDVMLARRRQRAVGQA